MEKAVLVIAFDLKEFENRGDRQIVKLFLSLLWLFINQMKSQWINGVDGPQRVQAEYSHRPIQESANILCRHMLRLWSS